MDILHNDDLIRVPMDGRRHTLPVPVIEALRNLVRVKREGFAVVNGRVISWVTDAPFTGYTEATDGDTVLLAPYPYDDVYVKYLAAQIDIVNQEMQKYQNDMILFNAAYDTMTSWWNRNYMPKQQNRQLHI